MLLAMERMRSKIPQPFRFKALGWVEPRQSFLWQGILILLPVALMAAFGFWAVFRERNAVEEEAQRRAKEILDALPSDYFGRIAANRLDPVPRPKRRMADVSGNGRVGRAV